MDDITRTPCIRIGTVEDVMEGVILVRLTADAFSCVCGCCFCTCLKLLLLFSCPTEKNFLELFRRGGPVPSIIMRFVVDGNAGVTNASANDSEDADIAATPMIINMVRDVMNVTMSIFAFD